MRSLPRLALLTGVPALGLVLGTLWFARPGRAEEAPRVAYEVRFISLSGEGSSTKAWFEGAPASGVKVQEALDRFTKEGFRLASVSPAWRTSQVNVNSNVPSLGASTDPLFVLLLERGR